MVTVTKVECNTVVSEDVEIMPKFKLTEKPVRKLATFQLEDAPEYLHVIKLGWDNQYAVFWEDAYEIEPWATGLAVYTKEQILELFNIQL